MQASNSSLLWPSLMLRAVTVSSTEGSVSFYNAHNAVGNTGEVPDNWRFMKEEICRHVDVDKWTNRYANTKFLRFSIEIL